MNPFSLVILGVTSNLAQTKLIPALYDLAKRNLLPADFSIIGVARSKKTRAEFQEYVQVQYFLDIPPFFSM